jgi:small subunit ribosomal protein S16
VSVKIRLMRTGKIRTPHFRIVVSDSRKARNGLSIEEIGRYSPSTEPSFIEVDSARAQYWLGVGAQPTEAVEAILKITGDWQKAKGLPGAEGTLKKIAPKTPKQVAYEAAVKEAQNAPADGATTLKKKAAEKLAAKANPVVEEPKAEAPAEAPVVEEAPAEAVAETPAEETPVAQAEEAATEAAAE